MPEDITQASPDVAVNVSHDHPSPLIPEARVPNRKCLTIIKIPRSRFSELIEPLSFESDSATDNKGTSSLPPSKPDSDDHGPTTCSLLANKWQIILSFAGILFLISTITISPLKHRLILGHHLWKFAALLLSVFCSLLISDRLVEAYQRQKSLIHAIIDTEIIVWNLNVLANISMAMICFMITLVVAGVTTTKVLVASFSQILLLGFMFQNTAKTIFECIVFVFVRLPFDVGDCCVIDGVKMIVEEINIMTTVFLQFDHEKIYYPNSELSKKPISNCSRSPHMGEKIEFSIGISTPEKSVTKLTERIKQYLVSKSDYWQPKHSLFMTGIEDSKMKIDLNVLHRKNYKNFHEMNKRKSELLFELNTIFQELGIENYAIPKETTSVKNEKDDISKETTPSLPKHHG